MTRAQEKAYKKLEKLLLSAQKRGEREFRRSLEVKPNPALLRKLKRNLLAARKGK